jgi:hypothetical protein
MTHWLLIKQSKTNYSQELGLTFFEVILGTLLHIDLASKGIIFFLFIFLQLGLPTRAASQFLC